MTITRRSMLKAYLLSLTSFISGCSSIGPTRSRTTTTRVQGFDVEIINRSSDAHKVTVELESSSGKQVFAGETSVGAGSNQEFNEVIPATTKETKYSIQVKLDSGRESSATFTAARDGHFRGIIVTIQGDNSISIGELLATERYGLPRTVFRTASSLLCTSSQKGIW